MRSIEKQASNTSLRQAEAWILSCLTAYSLQGNIHASMYLKGSNWRMTRRRPKRSNPFTVVILVLLIGAMIYINQVVVPQTPPLFIPTATATVSPESFVSEARALFESGSLLQSIEKYEQAIFSDATNPSVYLELARVQMFAGQYEEALESAENALLISPNNAQAKALRAWSLLNTGDTLEAEAEVEEALALDINNALAHAVKAELLLETFDFERAGEESRLALELERSIETHRARGIVLYNTGNYQEAIQEFLAGLAINNNIPELHLLIGLNHFALGDYDQAVVEYNKANALNPSDALPDYLISRTYLIVGQYAKAIQFAEEAVQDDPENPALHGNLGEALYQNFQYSDAIPELKIAVENIPLADVPQTVRFYTIYGYALLKTNRCNEAVPVFQSLLSNIPESNEVAIFNATEGINQCRALVGDGFIEEDDPLPVESPEEDSGATPEPAP